MKTTPPLPRETSGIEFSDLIERPDPVRPDPDGPPPLCVRHCDTCGNDFETEMVWHLAGHWMPYGRECLQCAKTRESGRWAVSTAEKSRFWEKLCPAGYRHPDQVARIPKPLEAWLKTTIKEHPESGILLSGPAGAFKTTGILNVVVKRLIYRGHRPVFLTAMGFRQDASKASKDGHLKQWLREFQSKPWLIFDDFGNGADSAAAVEAIHSLTEHRRGRGLPMLITTQFTSMPVLLERFKTNPNQGRAIIERLKAICPNRLDTTQTSPTT